MLSKISPLYASLFGHKDRITIGNRVYDALESLLPGDNDCMTLLTTVKEQNSVLKNVLSQAKRASVFTPRLKNIVSERAAVITYIKNFIDTQSLYFIDNKVQKAAQSLAIELKHVLDANKIRNYAGGSIAAEEIIKVCAKKKNKERVKLLGLEDALAKLVEVQTTFTETYTIKVTTEHENQNINITKASEQLFASLEFLFDYISSQAILKKGVYIKAVKTINEILEDVETIARARKTKHTNHDDEEAGESMQNGNAVEQAA